ncbi:MAG: DUF1684 domain-containing protein [Anaerolineales bacterium]
MATDLSIEQAKVIEKFRAQREANLRREYGWLSLAGLFWLQEGENGFGSAADNAIRLPGRAPERGGTFTLRGGQVTVTPAEGVSLRVNDTELVGTSGALKLDTSGQTDFVFVDDLRLAVIERGGQLAIRVWDPQSPVRREFSGCTWYKPDSRFRVTANVEPYAEAKQVMIEDIIGISRPAEMQAALSFTVNGSANRLDAESLEDGSFDLIFKDSTADNGTYPAGRYLTTEVAEGGQVVIDFNYAYNPPCAFTEFATCPLPLPQNILAVAIEAGEKYQGHA